MNKNAIVVMLDSLGFNYVGCYGNEWIETPNLDRLAREGALFENAYTEGLPTVPCRRAMHTGRYTLPFAGWVPLTMEETTIADLCWGRPIDTALIFDCPNYRLPKFGYTRAFDKVWYTHGHEGDTYYYENDELFHYDANDYVNEDTMKAYKARLGEGAAAANLDEIESFLKHRQYGGERNENRYVAKTIDKAIEYLEQVSRRKQFFLWVDSFDPHEPWDPPTVYDPHKPSTRYDPDYKGKDEFLPIMELVEGLYTEEQLHHVRMLYAEMVTLVDSYLGKLVDAIERLGFYENTLLMVVSDHGEPMGNGEHGHGIMRKCRPWPYEELAHIPFIVRGPGIKPGQRLKGFIQSCDVAPTVCDWLGIGVHPDMHGKSLLPMLFGEVEKVRDFSISGYYPYSMAIYTEDWSYIHWKDKSESGNMNADFYGAHVEGSHLEAVGGRSYSQFTNPFSGLDENDKTALKGAEEQRQLDAVTLDGEDQWTCTPGAKAEVPEKDELYDRKNDPFQLNNIADKHPEIAMQLFNQLREFMTELKTL